jgi:hypothetical protein
VKGLRDEQEVEERLRDEIDADLSDFQGARFVETAVDEALESLPFDEEARLLLGLVTFDGQDRAALMNLIRRVAIGAVGLIGRSVLGRALREKDAPDAAIADEKTGQVTDEAAARAPKKVEVKPPAKSRRKKKRVPTPTPAELEAAIDATPKKKTTRRRRR